MLALIPFLILLSGVGLIPLIARHRPRYVSQTAVSISGLTLLLWLILRTQLPITLNLSNWINSGTISALAWHIDLLNWQVTTAVLLLLFATSLSKFNAPSSEMGDLLIAFLLTAVSLIAIWSNNLITLIVGLTLLSIPWLLAVWQQTTADNNGRQMRYMLMLIASILLLWYAAATSPTSDGWQLQLIATNGQTAVAFAAAILVGIWPFYGWRLRLINLPSAEALFLLMIPTAIGGVLWARLADSAHLDFPVQLLLTLMALFGFLRGVRMAWARLQYPQELAIALLFAQAQLIILAGVWTNGAATVAELRVLLLVGGILFLASQERLSRVRAWQALAPIMAVASLTALPLTAGFVGRAALYSAWIANGRFLLPFVLAILTVPLITAVYLRFWLPQNNETETPPPESSPLTATQTSRDAGLILLAMGLLAIFGVGWGDVHPLAWVLILLTAIVGLILPRFVGEVQRMETLFQQAFPFGSRWQPHNLKGVAQDVGTAVRDAADILEGEGGLVWLFVLAVLFFLLS